MSHLIFIFFHLIFCFSFLAKENYFLCVLEIVNLKYFRQIMATLVGTHTSHHLEHYSNRKHSEYQVTNLQTIF